MDQEQNMDEFTAAEIYSCTNVCAEDLQWAAPRFAECVRSWWLFPNWFWLLLACLGLGLTYLDWFTPWGRLGGGVLALYAGVQYGTRLMVLDYFQEGVDFGKILGVLRTRGIDLGLWDEISEKGHNFITECEVGALGADEKREE